MTTLEQWTREIDSRTDSETGGTVDLLLVHGFDPQCFAVLLRESDGTTGHVQTFSTFEDARHFYDHPHVYV